MRRRLKMIAQFRGSTRPEWRGSTDAEGKFEWNGSPAGPQQFSFSAPKFRYTDATLQPGDTMHTIQLLREATLSGRVIDQETQQPITQFFALAGQSFGNSQRVTGYASNEEKDFKNPEGKFEVILLRPGANAVQVRAQGYLTTVKVSTRGTSEPLLITLKRSSAYQGRVVDPGGRPMPGIAVAGVASSGDSIMIDRDGISRLSRVDRTTTDANGEFSLEPTTEFAALIAADPTHFFESEHRRISAKQNAGSAPARPH